MAQAAEHLVGRADDLPLSGGPETRTKLGPTPPDFATPSETSPDTTILMTCGNRT